MLNVNEGYLCVVGFLIYFSIYSNFFTVILEYLYHGEEGERARWKTCLRSLGN